MSTGSVILSNHLNLCCPPFLLPSIFPSIRVLFQWIFRVDFLSGHDDCLTMDKSSNVLALYQAEARIMTCWELSAVILETQVESLKESEANIKGSRSNAVKGDPETVFCPFLILDIIFKPWQINLPWSLIVPGLSHYMIPFMYKLIRVRFSKTYLLRMLSMVRQYFSCQMK